MKELAALVRVQARGTVTVVKAVGKKGNKRGQTELRPVKVKRACPGFGGIPCRKKSYVKSNGTGELCSYCREHVLSTYQLRSADRARLRLLSLSRRGVGLRTVAEFAELSRTHLAKIKNGRTKRISPDVEAAILNFKLPEPEPAPETCETCGLSHRPAARWYRIARMLPATFRDIWEAYPCTYPPEERRGPYENRMLHRDLESIGAVKRFGVYEIPHGKRADPRVSGDA